MTLKSLASRLSKLEGRSADEDASHASGMQWLRDTLAAFEERDGPRPPRTAEDDLRFNEHMRWLAERNPDLQKDLHLWLKSVPE
ncbi:hypothetical protein GCM10022276_19860 [Sphingomonas limnosediminicola]|uniref:Uncharacterized protein n=1 Tax=Sphingomonas limnosediminicola TaxID=940133 RepID=A0ABP7LHX4_9SPHN